MEYPSAESIKTEKRMDVKLNCKWRKEGEKDY